MKKILVAILLLVTFYFSSVHVVVAQKSYIDESLGYRYRATFKINDEEVHVYTDIWVYNNGNSDVWVAAPHSGLGSTAGALSIVMVPSCIVLVGRHVQVIKRSDGIENRHRPYNGNMMIMLPVTIYDFSEKSEITFTDSECRK